MTADGPTKRPWLNVGATTAPGLTVTLMSMRLLSANGGVVGMIDRSLWYYVVTVKSAACVASELS
jgi:hypothetical protein